MKLKKLLLPTVVGLLPILMGTLTNPILKPLTSDAVASPSYKYNPFVLKILGVALGETIWFLLTSLR